MKFGSSVFIVLESNPSVDIYIIFCDVNYSLTVAEIIIDHSPESNTLRLQCSGGVNLVVNTLTKAQKSCAVGQFIIICFSIVFVRSWYYNDDNAHEI